MFIFEQQLDDDDDVSNKHSGLSFFSSPREARFQGTDAEALHSWKKLNVSLLTFPNEL